MKLPNPKQPNKECMNLYLDLDPETRYKRNTERLLLQLLQSLFTTTTIGRVQAQVKWGVKILGGEQQLCYNCSVRIMCGSLVDLRTPMSVGKMTGYMLMI